MISKPKTDYIAVLDVGSSKIICLIAHVDSDESIKIMGIGHQISQGIKSGIIIDMSLAEGSIRAAVSAAEQMAGLNIDHVIINISGSQQASYHIDEKTPINHNQAITVRDIQRLIDKGCKSLLEDDRHFLHCIPLDYQIDKSTGISDPLGMYGTELSSTLHIIAASSTCIYNLTNCLAHCQLDVDDYIISSYASALACLNKDEKMLGVILIEFSGSNTSILAYKGNRLHHIDTIALGHSHITNDIAIGLSTNIKAAERIKTLHGNLFVSTNHNRNTIDVPTLSQNQDDTSQEIHHVEMSSLIEIIKPRVEEITDLIEDKLKQAHLDQIGRNIVITGGGSQLSGLKEYLEQRFNKNVRIGSPTPLDGLAESTKGPAFSCVVGLLLYEVEKRKSQSKFMLNRSFNLKQTLISVAHWFKENF